MDDRDAWRELAIQVDAAYDLKSPAVLGDPGIWSRVTRGEPTLALLSSARAPAGVLLAVHDLAKAWRHRGPIIISGFHAPVENEALSVLLRGTCPMILVLARGLYRRLPKELRAAIDDRRLLIVSPFKENVRRVSAVTAAVRNRVVASLSDEVLIAYADPNSKTRSLAVEVLSWGKRVYTLDHPANADLLELGLSRYVLTY